MTYSTTTTIKGSSRGTAGTIYQWALKQGCERPADVLAYLTTLSRLCTTHGLRFEVLVAQSIHECSDVDSGAPWASYWWAQRCNPAGIGITGDPAQNDASRDFMTGDSAARAHFLHMYLYAVGDDVPTGLSKTDDPRWDAAVSAGYAGIAKTIKDLTNRWGMDSAYDSGVVKHLNMLDTAGLLTPGTSVEAPEKEPTMADPIDVASDAIKTAQRPYFLVTAGHRSYGDDGDPTEKSLTGYMAEAYVKALRAAGYEADWYQRDLDGDSDPTMSNGGLDGVALGCGRILAKRTNALSILLDCHYNGPNSAMHVIVPDTVGLGTAYAGGAPSDDTAANNTEDVKVGLAIAKEIIAATGLATYRGRLGLAGIMSERETGVALSYDARLAMFAATASSRAKAVRLVVEHGGYRDTPATKDDFTAKCANAVVKAINGIYGTATSTPPKPADPKPVDPPPVVIKPSPVVYPKNLNKEIAAIFFGKAKGNDGREYGYDENGPVSKMWLAEGAKTGNFPHLVTATVLGSAKYFAFSNGVVYYQPSPKEVIRQYAAA